MISLFGGSSQTGGAGVDSFGSYYVGGLAITDFSAADETISVSASNLGGGLTTGAPITAAQFHIGSVAADKSDRFIYNSNTGALFFDVDGTGAEQQSLFATLSAGLAITNTNIVVGS